MTVLLGAATVPSPFWFLTRSTGIIALALLTLAVASASRTYATTRWREHRGSSSALVHRNASLLAVTFGTG